MGGRSPHRDLQLAFSAGVMPVRGVQGEEREIGRGILNRVERTLVCFHKLKAALQEKVMWEARANHVPVVSFVWSPANVIGE